MKKIFLLFSVAFLFWANFALAQNQVDLYFFYTEGCPYCAKVKPFLDGLKNQYPGLRLYEYEISQDPVNQELYLTMVKAYGKEPEGVPAVFIGEQAIFGYDESMNGQFFQTIEKCLQSNCLSPAEKIKSTGKQKPANEQSSKINSEQFFWSVIIAIFLILAISFFFRRKNAS